MIPKRSKRVAEEIHRGIAVILEKNVTDPRLFGTTITRIKISPDLKRAVIYFSMIGDVAARENAVKGFQRAQSFIRRELGHHLKLRCTPCLQFYYDDSIEYAIRMSRTLEQLKEEREETSETDR